jgi:sulfur-oxidizing protein SoxX
MHRAAALLLLGAAGAAGAEVPPGGYEVVGDGIPLPLTATPGDAARGRAIVASRQTGLCLLCHAAPIPEERLQGNIGTDLAGAGARWTEAQLRLRVADARRLNPATTMPAAYRTDGLQQVGSAWQGRTVLSAQQVEDVVAYLRTLR